MCKTLCGHKVAFFLDMYPAVEFLGRMSILKYFEEIHIIFQSGRNRFIFLPAMYESLKCSTSLTIHFLHFVCNCHPSGYEVYLTVVLTCIYLLVNGVKHLSVCLLAICVAT